MTASGAEFCPRPGYPGRAVGGVLAVGGGSAAPPRLIEASWRSRGARHGIRLVLVGKGITFDPAASTARPARPPDAVLHYGGRTSEINNTDAEGRIVVADALAYAAATLKATALVDVATLTGRIAGRTQLPLELIGGLVPALASND